MSTFPRFLSHTLPTGFKEAYYQKNVEGVIGVEDLKLKLKELLTAITGKDAGGFWLYENAENGWVMDWFGEDEKEGDSNVFLSLCSEADHQRLDARKQKSHIVHFEKREAHLSLTSPFADEESGALLAYLLSKKVPDSSLSIVNHPATLPTHPCKSLLLHSLFHYSVTTQPERIALSWISPSHSVTWTYAVLNKNANTIARSLSQKGIKNAIVPLLMDSDTPFVYAAILGILKSANAFCPLPTDLAVGTPASRVEYMLKDTAAKVVLCTSAKKKEFSEAGGNLEGCDWMSIDDLNFDLEDAEWFDVPREENDLSYVLYTSGTTGNPKGVLLPHRAVAASILSHPLQNVPPERVLAHIPLTFDVSQFEIFWPLLHAKTICSLARSIALAPSPEFEDYVKKLDVDMIEATPTRLGMLQSERLGGVRIKSTIGEMITKRVVGSYATDPNLPEGNRKELINFFGPTEAAIQCTSRIVYPSTNLSNVGPPFSPTSLFIFATDAIEPLPKGFVGEIVLGGHQLALGYLNLPHVTEKVFINHEKFGPLYRTGDRGTILPDGSLEIWGRADEQVKRNGVRIELGEITRAIVPISEEGVTMQLRHPTLGEDDLPYLVTFVAEPEHDNEKLFTMSEAAVLRAKNLIYQASQSLPLNMRPIPVVLSKWPVNLLNGKFEKGRVRKEFELFDLGAWRQLIGDDGQLDGPGEKESALKEVVDAVGGIANMSETKATMVKLALRERGWAIDTEKLMRCSSLEEALSLIAEVKSSMEEKVERTFRNFIRLKGTDTLSLGTNLITTYGLDSLAAVRLSSALRLEQLHVSPLDILRNPTIKSIASQVHVISVAPSEAFTIPETPASVLTTAASQMGLDKNDIQGVYRCSAIQSGMIFATMSSAENTSQYIRHWKYVLKPNVDVQRVQKALVEVLQQNSIWRTAFIPAEGLGERFEKDSYAMVVLKRFEFSWIAGENRSEIEKSIVASELKIPPIRLSTWTIDGGNTVVMISAHHALYDGETIELLENAVRRIYYGEKTAIIDQEYYVACEKVLKDSENIDFRGHWAMRLQGYSSQSLPDLTQMRVKGDKTFHVLQRPFSISRETAKTLCSNAGFASLRAPAAVATAICIGAYTGTKDVMLGEVLNGRIGIGTENVMGPMITTIPLRIDAIGRSSDTWSDFVKSIEKVQSEDWEFRHVEPHVVRKLVGLKDEAIFNIVFVFQNDGGDDDLDKTSIWSSQIVNENIDVEHQVAVDIQGSAKGYILEVTCDSHYFSEYSAQILLDQIDATLALILQEPNRFLADPLAETSFPHNLLSIFGRPDFNELPASMAHDWVSNHAKLRPNAVAVEVEDELSGEMSYLSYAQLDSKSNQFARFLMDTMDVKQEDKIAICMPRTIGFHIALLGILKARACYVPIATEVPTERKCYILSDSLASIVISTPEFSAELQTSGTEVLMVDSALDSALSLSSTPLDEYNYDVKSLAFLLYTSGSTGNPKGCLLCHDGLYHAIVGISQHAESFTDPDHDKYMGLTSLAFDVHLCETFVAWRLGIRISTANRNFILSDLEGFIRKHEITHVSLVPSLFEGAIGEPETPLNIKFVASGGERITDTLLERWSEKSALMNFFGPAEATIGVSGGRMSLNSQPANVGSLFPACQGWIVDEDMHCVVRGQAGELVVTGPLVGRGYHRLEELSGKVFLKDWPKSGLKSYRTGDIVRLMPDNTIEILGRSDSQIKINGVRIEPEGISQKLKKVLQYKYNIATVPIFRNGKAKMLVTFIADAGKPVVKQNSDYPQILSTNDDNCRQAAHAAAEVLPPYMRPAQIFYIDNIPLGATGKVDIKLLRTVHANVTPVVSNTQVVTHIDPFVNDVRAVVSKQLGLEPNLIPLDSNLFELGYDSTTLVRLTSSLRRTFQSSITIRQILSNPVISGIAESLQRHSSSTPSSNGDPLDEFRRMWEPSVHMRFSTEQYENIFPPFTMQEGVVARSFEDPRLYVNHFAYQLATDIDVDRFKKCWQLVIRGNEILRCVHLLERRLIQVILKPSTDTLIFEEHLTTESEITFGQIFMGNFAPHLAEDIVSSETRPPFRLTLFHGSSRTYFALSIHHSLYDAVSIEILLRQVEDLYHEKVLSSQSYPGFSTILRELSIHSTETTFWSNWLSDYNFTKRETVGRNSTAKEVCLKSRLVRKEIERLAKRQAVTIQAVGQTAFGSTLARWKNCKDIVYGVIRSGRSLPLEHISDATVPMLTILPFRFRLTDNQPLIQCQKDLNEVISREHTSLSAIQQILGQRDLFHVVFSLAHSARKPDPSIWQQVTEVEEKQPDYTLAVEMVVDDIQEDIFWNIVYSSSEWTSNDITTFLNILDETLCLIVQSDGTSLGIPTIDIQPETTYYIPTPSTINLSIEVPKDVTNTILQCFHDLFGDTQVDIPTNENLIRYGLDSIGAISLAKYLRKAGYQVTAVEILTHGSIDNIARFLVAGKDIKPSHVHPSPNHGAWIARVASAIQNAPRLSETDNPTFAPATILQSGMLSQTIESENNIYLNTFTFIVIDDTALEIFKQSCVLLTDSADILRTSFAYCEASAEWIQVIHSPGTTFRWYNDNEVDGAVHNYRDVNDFSIPPIYWQVKHYQGEIRIQLSIHHALYDGTSFNILLQYLRCVCAKEEPPRLVSFTEAAWHISQNQESGVAHWLQQLTDAPILKFEKKDKEEISSHSATLVASLLVSDVTEAIRDIGVTLDCVGQLLFSYMLRAISQLDDVVFGQIVSGRGGSLTADLSEAFGPTFNTLVRRVNLKGGHDHRSLLLDIFRQNINSLPHHHTSLQGLQKAIGRGNLFDALYTFQVEDSDELRSTVWKLEEQPEVIAGSQYSLNFEMIQRNNRVQFLLASRDAGFTVQDLESMIKFMDDSLADLIRALTVPRLELQGSMVRVMLPGSTVISSPIVWSPERLRLRQLLSQMLHVDPHSLVANQTLSSLGLDSITAIRLAGQARRIQISLSASKVFKCQTIGELFALLPASQVASPSNPASESLVSYSYESTDATSQDIRSHISPDLKVPGHLTTQAETSIPLSPGQTFFLEKWLESDRSRFHHIFAWKSKITSADISRLISAWNLLVHRHPLLRSVPMTTSSGAINHLILRHQVIKTLPIVDIKDLEDGVAAFVKTWAEESFDARNPAVEIKILKSNENEIVMALKILHTLYDAFSLPLLLGDLTSLYLGQQPSSDSNYAPFASHSSSSKIPGFVKFWETSKPTSPACWPVLHDQQQTSRRIFWQEEETISDLHALEVLLERRGIKLSSFLLAVLSKVASKRGAQSDQSIFGLYVSGRSCEGGDLLAGPTLNVLPLVVKEVDVLTVDSIAKDIAETLESLSDYEQSSLKEVASIWDWDESAAATNMMVNLVRIDKMTELGSNEELFEQIRFGHAIYTPKEIGPSYLENLKPSTSLLKDDISLDIVIDSSKNCIGFAVNCLESILNMEQVQGVIKELGNIINEEMRSVE